MKVTVDKINGKVMVEKEKGDPNFKRSGWGDAESTFLYHVKQELQKQGYDCIKKRMWKDGHLVDDTQQYIRDRKGNWCVYNWMYATYDAGEVFNEDGAYELAYVELS
jgi:hypothetical protein